jgi:DNA-binding MarR family transcriptional regulator
MTASALQGQVVGSMRALSTEIDRLDQAAADLFGLNRTDMRALDIISRAGPLAPTALARLLGFTTGGVTTVLDRLERAGYVFRRPDPGDRRRQVVAATETAAAREQEVFGELIHATSDLLAAYTDDQLLAIDDFLNRIRRLTADCADALAATTAPTHAPPKDRRSRGVQ